MGPTRWFGVEAAWGKSLEFRLVKLVPIADAPSAGDYGGYPVIAMGVRRDLCVRRHTKHNGVHTLLIRITFEHDGLNPADARTSSARSAVLQETCTRWE